MHKTNYKLIRGPENYLLRCSNVWILPNGESEAKIQFLLRQLHNITHYIKIIKALKHLNINLTEDFL